VYAAALGSATRRATGRTADGWLPHNIPFEDLPDAFETIAAAAGERDRDPDEIRVAPYVPSSVHEDESRARDAVRNHVAYYVGNGKGYEAAVAQRFPDDAAAVAEAWRSGEREAAREAVTEGMIDALSIVGTPEQAREQFAELHDSEVIDEPLVVIPNGAPQDVKETTVEALGPDN
jgi:5,10-methylenetetrahydromethanopterin reductase